MFRLRSASVRPPAPRERATARRARPSRPGAGSGRQPGGGLTSRNPAGASVEGAALRTSAARAGAVSVTAPAPEEGALSFTCSAGPGSAGGGADGAGRRGGAEAAAGAAAVIRAPVPKGSAVPGAAVRATRSPRAKGATVAAVRTVGAALSPVDVSCESLSGCAAVIASSGGRALGVEAPVCAEASGPADADRAEITASKALPPWGGVSVFPSRPGVDEVASCARRSGRKN